MHLQAGIYNEHIQRLAAVLEAWKDDADKYAAKIAVTQQNNQPTAGMEVLQGKQQQRMQAIEQFVSTAHNYILAMEEEITRLKKMQQPAINYVNTQERVRICDMPIGESERHLDVMEMLYSIEQKLEKKSTVY